MIIDGNEHSQSMLICSLTVCVYLQVCVRDNMIFAHENKKKMRRQSKLLVAVKQLNLIKKCISQQHTHCSRRRVKEKRMHESAHWKCKVNCYCCVLLLLCSLTDSRESCRLFLSLSLYPSPSRHLIEYSIIISLLTK
jgi:hypothetical protein